VLRQKPLRSTPEQKLGPQNQERKAKSKIRCDVGKMNWKRSEVTRSGAGAE